MSLSEKLLQAIEDNDLDQVQRLLQAGADPNARQGKRHALDRVHPRRDDIRCALIEAGAHDPSLLDSLVWAVNTGRLATVQALIERGADANAKTHSGTPLQVAARLGHKDMAEALLQAGADVQAGNSVGSPLAAAVSAGHSQLALLLLAHGAQPEALESAAALGLGQVVAALARAGVEVDRRCSQHRSIPLVDFTALQAACQADQVEVVDLLLRAGADPHLRDGQGADAWELATPAVRALLSQRGVVSRRSPEQALLAAAEAGQEGPLRAALRDRPNLNAGDPRRLSRGSTALHLAARNGHERCVEILLEAGASVDSLDAEVPSAGLKQTYNFLGLEGLEGCPLGRTPLFGAAQNGHLAIVERLLSAGARAHRQDFLAFSPLYLAAQNGHTPLLQTLIDAGADINSSGPGKNTPLRAALEQRHRQCAKLLLQHGASIQGGATTAIMWAAESADPELLQMMLDRKARLTAAKNSSPPLARVVGATHQVPHQEAPPGQWVTTWSGQGGMATVPLPEAQILEALEVLLKAGADPNAPGFLGRPLMVAARQGLSQVVRRLLQAGADATLTHNNDSALSLAQLFEHQEVVDILSNQPQPAPRPDPLPGATPPAPPELPQPDYRAARQCPEFLQAVTELEQICDS